MPDDADHRARRERAPHHVLAKHPRYQSAEQLHTGGRVQGHRCTKRAKHDRPGEVGQLQVAHRCEGDQARECGEPKKLVEGEADHAGE